MCSMRNLHMKIALPSWKNPRPPNFLNPLRYTQTKAIFIANCSPASVQKQWKISVAWPKITTTMGIFFIALSNSLWSKLAIRPESGLEVRSFFCLCLENMGLGNWTLKTEVNFELFSILSHSGSTASQWNKSPLFIQKFTWFWYFKKVNFVKNDRNVNFV